MAEDVEAQLEIDPDMRLTASLACLLIVSLVGPAQVAAAEEEPGRQVSAICAYEFASAADLRAAVEAAAAGAEDVPPDTPTELPADWLDRAIRSCASLDDWLAAATLFPDALDGLDPIEFVTERCRDTSLGLEAYATCHSLEIALATPMPVETHGPEPAQAPADSAQSATDLEQGAQPTEGEREPRRGPRARVSRDFVVKVPGATQVRYFQIRGRTPWRLLAENQVRSRPHCGTHQAIACVLMTWSLDVTKRYDQKTRACTMSKVRTTLKSVVYLPRWIHRRGARPALVKWWRQVVLESAEHEAEHIRIQQRHLAAFRREARGKPCGSASILFRRHIAAANRAQAAFDEIEYQKPLPELPASLLPSATVSPEER